MPIKQTSEAELIKLRDRCGLLTPETAWQVLQRLTWIDPLPHAVEMLNDAITDVEESDHESRTPTPLMRTCDAGKHQVINTNRRLPCPFCTFHQETNT